MPSSVINITAKSPKTLKNFQSLRPNLKTATSKCNNEILIEYS